MADSEIHSLPELRQYVAQKEACDRTAFDAAVRLTRDDADMVRRTLGQITYQDIDFNHDNNNLGGTWEWGATLVAAAELAAKSGIKLDQVPKDQLVPAAFKVYKDMQQELVNERANSGTGR